MISKFIFEFLLVVLHHLNIPNKEHIKQFIKNKLELGLAFYEGDIDKYCWPDFDFDGDFNKYLNDVMLNIYLFLKSNNYDLIENWYLYEDGMKVLYEDQEGILILDNVDYNFYLRINDKNIYISNEIKSKIKKVE